MRSLVELEQSLLEESIDGVKSYLLEIDRKTSNECFKLLGENLGLTVMEIDGICYAHLASASQIMGYADPSGLAKLMGTYQIMTPKIGWYGLEVRPRIREIFNLNHKDSEATFVPYAGMLVAGMSGTTEGAKKIKLYLLKAERTARVAIATVDSFKEEVFRVRRCKEIVSMVVAIARMDDSPYKDVAIEHFESLTGKTFPKSKQKKLFD